MEAGLLRDLAQNVQARIGQAQIGQAQIGQAQIGQAPNCQARIIATLSWPKGSVALAGTSRSVIRPVISSSPRTRYGEDIEVLEVPIDEAFAAIASGEIQDGKTIM